MIEKIICIDIKKEKRIFHLADSDGNQADISKPEALFDFLLIDADKPNSCKVVWNLFQLFSVLEALLPSDCTNKIIKEDRAWYKDYKIFSSSGKMLGIGYSRHLHDNFYAARVEVNIYGLRQYFPDDPAPNLDGLVQKSNELMQTIQELGWQTNSLSSSIAIYKNAVLDKEYIPTVYDLPDTPEAEGMIEYCYEAMCREWRTVYKVGHFTGAVDYDLRSGYPSIIRNFGNTSEATIKYSKKLQRCDFGVCKGKLNLIKDYHPIVNEYGQNVLGEYPDIITTKQLGFIYHYGYGSFEMEDGFFINFNDPDDKPFFDMMIGLYQMREFGGLKKTLAKNISVGIYGYQSQEYPEKYGDFFNPIYSLMTTTGCSLEVGKFIESNQLHSDLISVTVDGLVATKDVPIYSNNAIGEWRKESVNALILSVGHQYLADKKDSNQNTYSDMIEAIKKAPSKNYFNDVLLNKNMMNTNREFPKFPKTGYDLLEKVYESNPIRV
jgi:hypothetical protein